MNRPGTVSCPSTPASVRAPPPPSLFSPDANACYGYPSRHAPKVGPHDTMSLDNRQPSISKHHSVLHSISQAHTERSANVNQAAGLLDDPTQVQDSDLACSYTSILTGGSAIPYSVSCHDQVALDDRPAESTDTLPAIIRGRDLPVDSILNNLHIALDDFPRKRLQELIYPVALFSLPALDYLQQRVTLSFIEKRTRNIIGHMCTQASFGLDILKNRLQALLSLMEDMPLTEDAYVIRLSNELLGKRVGSANRPEMAHINEKMNDYGQLLNNIAALLPEYRAQNEQSNHEYETFLQQRRQHFVDTHDETGALLKKRPDSQAPLPTTDHEKCRAVDSALPTVTLVLEELHRAEQSGMNRECFSSDRTYQSPQLASQKLESLFSSVSQASDRSQEIERLRALLIRSIRRKPPILYSLVLVLPPADSLDSMGRPLMFNLADDLPTCLFYDKKLEQTSTTSLDDVDIQGIRTDELSEEDIVQSLRVSSLTDASGIGPPYFLARIRRLLAMLEETGKGLFLKHSDFEQLYVQQMTSDTMVEMVFSILSCNLQLMHHVKLYCFSPFVFSTKNSVKFITRFVRLCRTSLSHIDLLVFPICRGQHWSMYCYSGCKSQLHGQLARRLGKYGFSGAFYADSLNASMDDIATDHEFLRVLCCLWDMMSEKFQEDLGSFKAMHIAKVQIPIQKNNYDCAFYLFVLCYLLCRQYRFSDASMLLSYNWKQYFSSNTVHAFRYWLINFFLTNAVIQPLTENDPLEPARKGAVAGISTSSKGVMDQDNASESSDSVIVISP